MNMKEILTSSQPADNSQPDMINQPPHYIGAGGIQAIDVIEDYGLDYHLGNAAKYIIRSGRKGCERDDLAKAAWYCRRWLAGPGAPCWVSPKRREAFEIIDDFELPENKGDALMWILDSALHFNGSHMMIRLAVEALAAAIAEIDTQAQPDTQTDTQAGEGNS